MSSCTGTSHRSSTGLYLRLKSIPKTSTFRDSYFPCIVQMWNALPDDVKCCTFFKCRLKNFFFNGLRVLFDQDNMLELNTEEGFMAYTAPEDGQHLWTVYAINPDFRGI